MRRPQIKYSYCYLQLECRQMLAGGLGPTSLAWIDAAGNVIGDNEIPNRTEITARLITSDALPNTLTASIYEDDLLFDDFVDDILLTNTGSNTWTGDWQATWTEDGSGLPEYYFQVDGVSGSSNSIDVIQGNGWHVQEDATGILNSTNQINVGIQPSEFPAGLSLDQVAIEVDFGSVTFGDVPHDFELVVTSPSTLWNTAIPIEQNYDFANPVIELFRSAGCSEACNGNDFSTAFLLDGQTNGFYGNWSIAANNLQSGDAVQIDNFRTTLTFHSRLHLSGYDPQLQPDDPYPDSNRDYGFLSDFNNVALSNTTATSAVILIHGWNPGTDGLGDNFADVYGGKFWSSLETSVSSFVDGTTDWLVGQYDWVNDAATGSNNAIEILETLASAPLSSRDVASAHGPFLGRALFGIQESLFSQLDAVQFIAHSAGNWVAMEAAAYLRSTGFNGDLQLTSLDPFVPDLSNVVGVGDVGVETERIFESGSESFQLPKDVLDNYYVDDADSDAFFGWTSGDYSPWTINRQLDAVPNPPFYDPSFDVHSGPIGWYAATGNFLLTGGDLSQLDENGLPIGFGSSLLFADWRFENAAELPTASINIIRGVQSGGSIGDLVSSDDTYVGIQPGKTMNASEAPILVEFSSILPGNNSDVLGFQFEASTNTVNVIQSIEVFNFISDSYEPFDVQDATLTDSVVTIRFMGDSSQFVSNRGEVKARVGWIPDGPVLFYPWAVNIDQAVWLIDNSAANLQVGADGMNIPMVVSVDSQASTFALPPIDSEDGRSPVLGFINKTNDTHASILLTANELILKTLVDETRLESDHYSQTGLAYSRFLLPDDGVKSLVEYSVLDSVFESAIDVADVLDLVHEIV